MDNFILCMIVLMVHLKGLVGDILGTKTIDVCQFTTRDITCDHNHVIVLTSALYGRIDGSSCLKDQVGVGCQANVIQQADRHCSGRGSCTIDSHNFAEFENHTAKIFTQVYGCTMAYKMHFHATYQCIKVEPFHSCVSTSVDGYLSSNIAQQSHKCASNWTILAQPGQRINLTMYDFDTSRHTLYSGPKYLSIRDTLADGNVNVEPVIGSSQRVQNVYLSVGNVVSLEFMRSQPNYFLVHYQVVGCPDITKPEGGWIKKVTATTVKMGCSHEHQMSALRCVGNTWQGEILNCTLHGEDTYNNGGGRSFTNVLVMVVILGVAVIICTTIVIIGICCFKSPRNRGRHRLPPTDVTYDPTTEQMIDHIKMTSPSCELPRKCMIHDSPLHHSHTMRPAKQQYEHIWQEQHAHTLNMKNTL